MAATCQVMEMLIHWLKVRKCDICVLQTGGVQFWSSPLVDLLSFFPPLPVEGIMDVKVTETYPVIDGTHTSLSTKSPADPTMVFFSMDYGKFGKLINEILSVLSVCLVFFSFSSTILYVA